MTRTPFTLAGRAVVAGVALSAMSLLAAAPANAAVPVLYTYLDEATSSYSTMDAVTGAVTPLATAPTEIVDEIVGEEVTNGVGTSIGAFYAEPTTYFVYDWNPATGASSVGVEAFVVGADEGSLYVSGLDTRNDGTLIAYVEYTITSGGEFPEPIQYAAVATLNKATGELTPVIDFIDFYDIGFEGISLATDPTTGISYLFMAQNEFDESYYSALDFDVAGLDLPSTFEGTGFESGFFQGADFDASGVLWFIYGNNNREMYELSTMVDPATWFSGARTYIADAASNYDPYPLSELALTTAAQPTAVLAETGTELPTVWLALGTVAVLGGVISVVAVSRKRRVA